MQRGVDWEILEIEAHHGREWHTTDEWENCQGGEGDVEIKRDLEKGDKS